MQGYVPGSDQARLAYAEGALNVLVYVEEMLTGRYHGGEGKEPRVETPLAPVDVLETVRYLKFQCQAMIEAGPPYNRPTDEALKTMGRILAKMWFRGMDKRNWNP